jgi:HPt (histidine-containing phosphotransfer) domain-containing protein
MDDYLTKPLRPKALAAVLDRWVVGHLPDPLTGPPDDQDPRSRAGRAGSGGAVLDAATIGRLQRLGQEAGVDLLSELARLFLADADAHVVAMRQKLDSVDPITMAGWAHALRGASVNLGATELAELCATLEANSTGDPVNSQNLVDALSSVETELERVRSALAPLILTP